MACITGDIIELAIDDTYACCIVTEPISHPRDFGVANPICMIVDAIIVHHFYNIVHFCLACKNGQDKLWTEINRTLPCRLIPRVSLRTILRNEAKIADLEATCGDT